MWHSPTDTKVSEEEEGGVVPGADSPATNDAGRGEAGCSDEAPGGPWCSRDPLNSL